MKEKIKEGFKMITGVAYRDLKKEWNDQNLEIDRLEWERNEARRSAEYLENKLEKERESVKKLKKEIKDLKAEFDKTKAEMKEKHKEEIENFKEDRNEILNELARTDSELIEARVQIDGLNNDLEIKDRVIADLNEMLKQANSTDNIQPDCAEDIPETPWGEDHEEMVVTEIEAIPGQLQFNFEDQNIIGGMSFTPRGDMNTDVTVAGKDVTKALEEVMDEFKPKKKTRKPSTKTTKKTTGKRTSKKTKEA